MRAHLLRGTAAVVAVSALAAVGAGSATGADPTPAPCGGTLGYKDPAKDQVDHTQAPAADQTPSTDIVGGFLLHEPARAADATSLNIVIKELKAEVPANYVSMTWFGNYVHDGKQYFLRAMLDFTGANVYEWGEFTPNPTGVGLTGASVYKGTTKGALFEGANGIVQIVIPAEAGGAANSKLEHIYSQAGQSRTTAPASTPGNAPRGTTPVLDTAPDVGGESKVTYTPAACTAATPVTGGNPLQQVPATVAAKPTGTSQVAETGGVAKLPVTVAAARAPKGRALSLRLKSTEPVTGLGARLRKGSKALGTGKLAKLGGSGTLKLKLARKVKKGTYDLDLAGNLADGRRALVTLKVRLK